jgi:hypothetical protein
MRNKVNVLLTQSALSLAAGRPGKLAQHAHVTTGASKTIAPIEGCVAPDQHVLSASEHCAKHCTPQQTWPNSKHDTNL